MGNSFSCIGAVSAERVDIDMSSVQNKNLPYIWLTGPPNTGKKTHGNLLKDKFDFDHIRITDLLRNEATRDTERGRIVRNALREDKRVNDYIVMDLLKQALLQSTTDRGFVISNFPKTTRQADMFAKDIGEVSFIFFLFCDASQLVDRAQERAGGEVNIDVLKKEIAFATKDIKVSLGKYAPKIESINSSEAPEQVFMKIENTLTRRLNIIRPIVAESDYVRPIGEQPDEPQAQHETDEGIY